MMRVLSVASELYPLVKTGGLADVTGALPRALAGHGIAMSTLLPGYPSVLAQLEQAETIHTEPDLHGGPARLLRGGAAGLDLLVLDAPHLFDRAGLYAGPRGDWPDNPQRFAALSRIAAQIAGGLLPDFVPDVLHAHDWQTGLLPAYLHYDRQSDGRIRPPCVFTIHNLAFQGAAPRETLAVLGLPPHSWSIEGVEAYGMIGFLKSGLQFADAITTVSPGYAAEIMTDIGGMGLGGLLRARRAVLRGIRNGIDREVWNPEADRRLASRYSAANLPSRAINKRALLQEFGLEPGLAAPLFAIISRLSWQKGIDLLCDTLPDLMRLGGKLVVLGIGDLGLERTLAEAAAQYPGQIGLRLGYDEDLAHRIQAGCDVLLVPSRFEPCGLTQLCALRYGAVPVVARTGGLADTVIDANDAALQDGVATGIVFSPIDAGGLFSAIERVFALWADKSAWARLQRRGMTRDMGWDAPARAYATLYRGLAAGSPM